MGRTHQQQHSLHPVEMDYVAGGRHTCPTRGHQTVTQFSPRRRVSLNAHLFKLFPANRGFLDWLQSCLLNPPSGVASLASQMTEGDDIGSQRSHFARSGRCLVPGCCPEAECPESPKSKRPSQVELPVSDG